MTTDLEREAERIHSADPRMSYAKARQIAAKARERLEARLGRTKTTPAPPKPRAAPPPKRRRAQSVPAPRKPHPKPSPARPQASGAKEKTMPTRATRDEIMVIADRRAAELRRARPELTHEQAVATVFEREPALYSAYQAAEPHAPPDPGPARSADAEGLRGAAWQAIEREAEAIRRERPELGSEGAVVAALERRPELYRQYVEG